MNKIIDKYFRDGKSLYFHPADLIADDHYLTYEMHGKRLILSIGSNNGETTIKTFNENDSEELESFIKSIIY